jgi:type IV pilus assembly protein PilY1
VHWNDGCDFQIVNNAEQPVVPVNYTMAWPASGVYPDAPVSTIDTTSSSYTYSTWYDSPTAVSRPGMNNTAPLDNSGALPNRWTTVQYMGAPFIIDAPDAQNVINFLQSGDALVAASDLAPYRTPCTCGTSYGNTPSPDCHYVAIHQATANFVAPVGRRFNQTPPKVALLDTGAGVQYYPHTTLPLRVLDGYLQNAGLYKVGTTNFTDSGGCPLGTTSGCTLNGGRPGVVYDQFNSYADLVTTGSYPRGLLNSLDSSGKLIYKVFWTPHWDTSNSIANRIYTGGDCTTGGQPQCQGSSNYTTVAPWPPNPDTRQNALDNVYYFLTQRGTGLMGECSAIDNYEGSINGGTTVTPVSTNTNFLFTGPVAKNAVGANFDGRNCTDPDYLAMS